MATFMVDGIPPARVKDLELRMADGHLNSVESLALAVLRAGPDGEHGVSPFIDAATEEYSHGSYRVPVRVIADRRKLLVILRTTRPLSAHTKRQLAADMMRAIGTDELNGRCVILDAGLVADFYEIGTQTDGPRVEVETSYGNGDKGGQRGARERDRGDGSTTAVTPDSRGARIGSVAPAVARGLRRRATGLKCST